MILITKDYAKRRPLRPRSRRYSAPSYGTSVLASAWLWMGAGLILGLVLAAGLYWKRHGTSPLQHITLFGEKENTAASQEATSTKQSNKPSAQEENPQTRFDFYTVLPNMTVDTPEEDKSATKTSPTTTAAPSKEQKPAEKTPATTESPAKIPYIIQVGSFRQREQADELKAQLALVGFEARMQTVKVMDGEVRYRVYIGPFDSKEKATSKQQELEQAHQFRSLVVKFGGQT